MASAGFVCRSQLLTCEPCRGAAPLATQPLLLLCPFKPVQVLLHPLLICGTAHIGLPLLLSRGSCRLLKGGFNRNGLGRAPGHFGPERRGFGVGRGEHANQPLGETA